MHMLPKSSVLLRGRGICGRSVVGIVEGVTPGLTVDNSQFIRILISRNRGPRQRKRRWSRKPVSDPRREVTTASMMVKRSVDQTKRHLLQDQLKLRRRGGEPFTTAWSSSLQLCLFASCIRTETLLVLLLLQPQCLVLLVARFFALLLLLVLRLALLLLLFLLRLALFVHLPLLHKEVSLLRCGLVLLPLVLLILI